jgi:hypothetical protein
VLPGIVLALCLAMDCAPSVADLETLFCRCGKQFTQENAYSKHQKYCRRTKVQLSGALERAKELWAAKKKKRLDTVSESAVQVQEPDATMDIDADSHSCIPVRLFPTQLPLLDASNR